MTKDDVKALAGERKAIVLDMHNTREFEQMVKAASDQDLGGIGCAVAEAHENIDQFGRIVHMEMTQRIKRLAQQDPARVKRLIREAGEQAKRAGVAVESADATTQGLLDQLLPQVEDKPLVDKGNDTIH